MKKTAQIQNLDHLIIKTVRLDAWLYQTRLVKTRTAATAIIISGKIRITRNGVTKRIKKPSTPINSGDQVSFIHFNRLIQVEMVASPKRRVSAVEAKSLYIDHESS